VQPALSVLDVLKNLNAHGPALGNRSAYPSHSTACRASDYQRPATTCDTFAVQNHEGDNMLGVVRLGVIGVTAIGQETESWPVLRIRKMARSVAINSSTLVTPTYSRRTIRALVSIE
jgi:hypothetical protein